MQKPISTKVHGVLDYMTAAFLHTLPRVMGWNRTPTTVLDSAGVAATGYSLLTRYELGAAKVLPMKAHLTLDALSGAALITAACLMDDEDDEVRMTIAGLGVFEIAAALLTQTEPDGAASGGSTGSRQSNRSGQLSLPIAPMPAPIAR
jgi:hypothetical protein